MLSIAFMPYHAIPPARRLLSPTDYRTFIQRVDYLWWHAVHQDIASSQVNIPITYQHAATQVVVAIAGGENITLNKILSATITPPKPGAIMDLSTGIITSEVSYDKAADMGNQRLHRTIYHVTRKELLSHDLDTGADGKRRKLFTYLHHSAHSTQQPPVSRKFIPFPGSYQ